MRSNDDGGGDGTGGGVARGPEMAQRLAAAQLEAARRSIDNSFREATSYGRRTTTPGGGDNIPDLVTNVAP